MPALFGKNLTELTELMQSFGQKPYRARQVWEALYRQRVASVEDMTTLSQELRERLMTEGVEWWSCRTSCKRRGRWTEQSAI